MDILWQYISTMTTPDHTPRFSMLVKVAMLVLVIPHAEEERVFSMVRKNKTAFRPSLEPKGTLSSILSIKLGHNKPAHQFEPTKQVLKKPNPLLGPITEDTCHSKIVIAAVILEIAVVIYVKFNRILAHRNKNICNFWLNQDQTSNFNNNF